MSMIGAFVGTRCRVVEQLVGGCTDRLNQFADTHEYARREAPRIFSLPLTILDERTTRAEHHRRLGIGRIPFLRQPYQSPLHLVFHARLQGGLSTFTSRAPTEQTTINCKHSLAITSSGCVLVVVVVIVTVATVYRRSSMFPSLLVRHRRVNPLSRGIINPAYATLELMCI
ncbi:hypothetical protein EAG_02135 [Camponotus floridanus]|uniref:Uncharacterized protein n=1 Tax=Camponotus floridanus TaxID=104421 RepID=E2B1R7_CAMFO|nr:hypothetical protein EAG_02135 [Camponotus floridanus]